MTVENMFCSHLASVLRGYATLLKDLSFSSATVVSFIIAHFHHFFGIRLCRFRQVGYSQFLCNCSFHYSMRNLCNQDIVIRRIYTTLKDVDEFTAIFSLLLVLANEVGLRIDLRGREPSSDRTVTRRTDIRESHSMNLAQCGSGGCLKRLPDKEPCR